MSLRLNMLALTLVSAMFLGACNSSSPTSPTPPPAGNPPAAAVVKLSSVEVWKGDPNPCNGCPVGTKLSPDPGTSDTYTLEGGRYSFEIYVDNPRKENVSTTLTVTSNMGYSNSWTFPQTNNSAGRVRFVSFSVATPPRASVSTLTLSVSESGTSPDSRVVTLTTTN